MVKMVNAYGEQIVIPAGAEGAYSNLGFTKVEKEVEAVEDTADEAEDSEEVDKDEELKAQIEKKPIASWNKEEVKQYARIVGIDLTGTKSAAEAKDRIKEYIAG